jgi:hypothetical protein
MVGVSAGCDTVSWENWLEALWREGLRPGCYVHAMIS